MHPAEIPVMENIQNIPQVGQVDDLLHEENLDDPLETNESWEQRREAVSDENWQRQQDNFQAEMAKLNERELVLEREQKLIEMKEKMIARQQKLREMEKTVSARHAAISRYEEQTPGTTGPSRVEQWVNDHAAGATNRESIHRVDLSAQTKHAKQQKHSTDNPYTTALELANDDNLIPCRQTGVSRLDTLGLGVRKLQRAGKSEPMLGERFDALRPKQVGFERQPVVGRQDDGESIKSIHSLMSDEVQKSETSEKKRKVKSGMYDKIADDVVMKLKWPHKKLDPRWVIKKPLMNQLQFEHVIAGEIAIILRSTNPDEVRCRLHILQKLSYWNLQDQGWPRVRDIYTSILHRLEEGEATWSDTFDEYDMVFPIKMSTAPKPAAYKREVFWCKDFNKATCNLESGHKATIAGKERPVMHICAACHKQGRREKHPENDPACPQREL